MSSICRGYRMKFRYAVIVLFAVLLSSAIFTSAILPGEELEQLENYTISVSLNNDGSAHIIHSFEVVNIATEPIVPGRARLILSQNIQPTNIVVDLAGARKLITDEKVQLKDDKVTINYEIWRPLLPGERIKVTIDFDSQDIVKKGIMFSQLDLELSEFDLPVQTITFLITPPEGKRITYANQKEAVVKEGKAEIVYDKVPANRPHAVSIEYSSLPLPLLSFHGYWLWLILLLIPLGFAVVLFFRNSRYREE